MLEAQLASARGEKQQHKPPATAHTPKKSALRDGKGSAPKCAECHEEHFGRCPSKRNFKLERKQLEADEARFRRQQEQKEKAAANKAETVGDWVTDDDSDKKQSPYLRVIVFDPANPTPSHIRVSANTTYLTKKKQRS